MWDCRPSSFLEIEIPDVAIDQGDNERGAQKNHRCSHMVPPIGVDAIDRDRGVKRERQAKEPEEKSKANAGSLFQKPADRECDKKSPDEYDHRHGRSLGIEPIEHLGRSISKKLRAETTFSRWIEQSLARC